MTSTSIENTQVKAGTITDTQVASANKDGTAGTPSLRTLGTGSQQAASGNDSRIVGAVTAVSVATANGISGSSSGGSTPALTLALGSITPTRVSMGDMFIGFGDGYVAYDATQQTIVYDTNANTVACPQWLIGALFTATASASNTTTAQTISMVGSGVGSMTIPANMPGIGCTLRLRARGVISTGGTPGGVTWQIKIGTVVVGATPSSNPIASLSNRYWSLDAEVCFRAVGASGSVFAQGIVIVQGTTTSLNIFPIRGNSADPPAVVTIDTTASRLIDFQTITASNPNTITCNMFTLERII